MLGKYRIQAVGVDSGAFRLEVTAIRGDCSRDTTLWMGRTRKGKIDAYSLEYRDGSGDTVPPATRIDCQEGAWLNRSRAEIRLHAEDTCSGLAKLWVKAEGGEEVEPGILRMHKQGESRLEFWSMDNAGNEEPRRKLTVRCDFSPPTVGHDYAGGKMAVGPVEIRFRALDSVSGRADLNVWVRHFWSTSPLDPHSREYRLSGSLMRLTEPGFYYLRFVPTLVPVKQAGPKGPAPYVAGPRPLIDR